MKTPRPTRPKMPRSMASRSAARDSGVASSGKWLLYWCMKRRARKRPWTSSGARQSYRTPEIIFS